MRILIFLLPLLLVISGCSNAESDDKSSATVLLQQEFDYLGPTIQTLDTPAGRSINYLDEGEEGWQPVLFIGGSGTSGRVFALLEFLRTTRQNLGLRIISVERNGFGITPFEDSRGYTEYAEDMEALLKHLEIDEFSLFAISGGGPYSAVMVNRNAERLTSIHLAAALTYYSDASIPQCALPEASLTIFTKNPIDWFRFAPESPVHTIPGFQDAAFDDAARTFNMGGQAGDPAPVYHEFQHYCQQQYLPDLAAVTAPVYLYYGESDDVVPIEPHARRWQAAYLNAPVKARFYSDEGHDVQYRHLDQVLVDLAGMGDQLVVCNDNDESVLVMASEVQESAFLGLCAWR